MSETSASTPTPEPDWTDQVTDLIVDTVDRVHDKTTGPLLQLARGVVYGTVAALVGIVVAVALFIVLVRILDLIPGDIWMAYMGCGAVFIIVGLILWSKRHPISD